MKSVRGFVTIVSFAVMPGLALGQSSSDIPAPPPLVEAQPPEMPPTGTPPPPPSAPPPPPVASNPAANPYGNQAPTPPPPGSTPPPAGAANPYGNPGLTPYAPGQPYSPYGAPYGNAAFQKPPPEVGLMFAEGAFGILTAAGVALIPYFLLLKPLASVAGTQDAALINLLTILTFAAVPLSAAETEVGLANGSRYYYSESWPALLTGLGAEAAVYGLTYVVGANGSGAGELFLLIGSVGFVPLAELVVINLVKQPKNKMPLGTFGAAVGYSPGTGFAASMPIPVPFISMAVASRSMGVDGLQVSLLKGVF